MTTEPVINFVICYNPLDLSERTLGTRPWFDDAPLADYAEGLPKDFTWAVGINGTLVEAEHWPTTYLRPGDFLTIVPVPHGGGSGGGGKMALRIVAMIVIAVAAYFTGGAAASLFSTLGGTASGAIGAAASAMVMAGGSMLPSAILPPPNADGPGIIGEPSFLPSGGDL